MAAPAPFTSTANITHFIQGERSAGVSTRSQPVFNPATGEAPRRVLLAEAADVHAAVASAPPIRRARILNAFLALLNQHRDTWPR
jgi:malonate-semialdehyde dehydrogenase (acetylating)/methylmalonate-semialdehyde dehydrogenase